VIPPLDTWDNDMWRELAFFDFELGGRNELDGEPVKHSSVILQLLSAHHCKDYFPAWGLEGLPRQDRPWRALDIGCGPISTLRWGALCGLLTVTGVDPLLEMYALLLARHGYDALPHVRCEVEFSSIAERLDELVPDSSFDLIHTRNALDHTQEPQRIVDSFARKLAPGGRVLLHGATCEGTRQEWDQFHKTDIDLKDGVLVYRHQHTPERPLLSPGSGLRLRKVAHHDADWLAVVLERA
jgi:SAM-dependent methyltransferase